MGEELDGLYRWSLIELLTIVLVAIVEGGVAMTVLVLTVVVVVVACELGGIGVVVSIIVGNVVLSITLVLVELEVE